MPIHLFMMMHSHNLDKWTHAHNFQIQDRASERRVLWVVVLTLFTMAAEICSGILFGSMALLADGWHMGTHAAALGITALAYHFARKHAQDRRFTFGTGKIGVLGGYSSAIILAVVALLMAVESLQRIFHPQSIRFNEALMVAVLGLVVNLASALMLQKPQHQEGPHATDEAHEHHHDHHHHHGGHDHNMRSAYMHVIADALTSLLAITALIAGKMWHWVWMDAMMGIVGSVIIGYWARGLLRDTASILLDRVNDQQTIERIYALIESDADNRIADLHIWNIGSNQMAAIVSIVTHFPRQPDYYKQLLTPIEEMAHITVEVTDCHTEPCIPVDGNVAK